MKKALLTTTALVALSGAAFADRVAVENGGTSHHTHSPTVVYHGTANINYTVPLKAVAGPAPGGVNYSQMRALIQGLVKKGRVLGMDIVEITPGKDVNGITAITAGRFICNLIGTAVRAGYFKK